MYGPMTRSSFPFHPSRLLCKRFNVKPPPDMPAGPDESEGHFASFKSQTAEAISKAEMQRLQHEFLTNGPPIQRPSWKGAPVDVDSAATVGVQQTEHAVVDVEKNDALLNERASEDVFKALFGDDDEEED
ncbi:hypothetical protein A1F94_000432 [Pyrenophora tritici-repentis]|nr:hypothetical protein A1F94_000432 [Pyrenophora tritici-repentis]